MSEFPVASDDVMAEGESGAPIVLHPATAQSGERLDVYLASELTDFSRSFLQQLIGSGNVLVDGLERKRTFKITAGQTISVSIPEPAPHDIQPQRFRFPSSTRMPISPLSINRPYGGPPGGWSCRWHAGQRPPLSLSEIASVAPIGRGLCTGSTRTPGSDRHRPDAAGQKLLLEQWADGSVQRV